MNIQRTFRHAPELSQVAPISAQVLGWFGTLQHAEHWIRQLLARAGVTVDGDAPWDIQVHDPRFYPRVLRDGTLGLGEAYMDGWWDAERLDDTVARLLRAHLERAVRENWRLAAQVALAKLSNLQSPKDARTVAERHYDLGNDFYAAMLDSRMNYTCAYWKEAETLDAAQEAKLDLVCRKIGLQPGQRVLELGCGWGAFAKFAAERYGAEVVGFNISKEQVASARAQCSGLPVTIHLDDYRNARGQFDAVVSIGLMEHVGPKNYRAYMELVERCLAPGGTAFIHTIGGNESSDTLDPWFHTYVFPNAVLPSLAQITAAAEGLFVIEDVHNIGPHYDTTLMAWLENFESAWPRFAKTFGERFYRMWKFYLQASAAGFRARYLQLYQLVLTRRGTQQPLCRQA
mgnify:CR=1 FL=1